MCVFYLAYFFKCLSQHLKIERSCVKIQTCIYLPLKRKGWPLCLYSQRNYQWQNYCLLHLVKTCPLQFAIASIFLYWSSDSKTMSKVVTISTILLIFLQQRNIYTYEMMDWSRRLGFSKNGRIYSFFSSRFLEIWLPYNNTV